MSQERMQFNTEVNKLLELMIHSLYSHKEIFLRELISTASDAIDKLRFEALTNDALLEGDADYKIKISADKDKNTLTVTDNGIGMTKDEAVKALGTIAHSGTKEFMQLIENKENNPDLIGQSGVGFNSAFMVADRATVTHAKRARTPASALCGNPQRTAHSQLKPMKRAKGEPPSFFILKRMQRNIPTNGRSKTLSKNIPIT